MTKLIQILSRLEGSVLLVSLMDRYLVAHTFQVDGTEVPVLRDFVDNIVDAGKRICIQQSKSVCGLGIINHHPLLMSFTHRHNYLCMPRRCARLDDSLGEKFLSFRLDEGSVFLTESS